LNRDRPFSELVGLISVVAVVAHQWEVRESLLSAVDLLSCIIEPSRLA